MSVHDVIKTEDRGDGRSRVHNVMMAVRAAAQLVVQRERDGSYVATLRRVGMLYPEKRQTVSAGSLGEAMMLAVDAFDLQVAGDV